MSKAMSQSRLFKPLRLGKNTLSNRIALAPMTRLRADDEHAPLDIVQDYYAQRGSVDGTMLITEATIISAQAGGYPNVPGIYTDKHIAQWKKVVDAVHAKGSSIWLQLWALGRVADPRNKVAENSGDVVSASAIPEKEGGTVPRALSEEEIHEYIANFARAARNAVHKAGFDGVEIHSANGYLPDQFLQDVSNQRTDQWGGSIENRSRFAIEIAKAVVGAVGAEHTGIRLSPWSAFQGMRMKDPIPQFNHVITELSNLKLAYLHLVESRDLDHGKSTTSESESSRPFVETWGNTSPVLLASSMTPDVALTTVDTDYKDKDVVAVFGRPFTSNPDLVYRIKNEISFTPYDRSTFYAPKAPKGYADWPFSKEWDAEFGVQK